MQPAHKAQMSDPHHRQSGRRPAAAQRSSRLLILSLALVTALAFLTVSLLRAAQPSRGHTQDTRALSAQQALPPEPGQSSLVHQAQQLRRPLDYVQHYAELEGKEYPQECRHHYHGLPYFDRIQASWRQPVCEPQAGAALGSSLRCHYQWDQYPEMHCTGANLALDLRAFAAEDALLPQESHPAQPNAFEFFKRPGLKGELLGDCKLVDAANRWQESRFGKGGQDWLFHSFRSTLGDAQQPACVAWVEHPIYFLNDKYDSSNLWHGLEDVTHAFEAFVLKGWGPEAQVVVVDAVTERNVLGPTYLPVWRKVFSPQHPPVTLRGMVAKVLTQAGSSSLPPHAALCFRDTFFSVHGGISILSRSIHSPTPCANSTFMRAMTHFITDGLQLTEVRPARQGGSTSAAAGAPAAQQIEEAVLQQAVGGRLMLPGYRSEVAAAAQAAAAPVSSDGAGQAAGKLWVVWALRTNRAEQQEEILDLLRRELPKQGIEFAALDFGQLPLEEQIRRARSADVLAGYHGAALTLACFMDPPAALVEVEEEWRCMCYTNCARWKGLDYRLIKVPSVPDGQLAAQVLGEILTALRALQQGLGRSTS